MFTFLGLGSLLIITERLVQSGKYRRSALLLCRDLIFPLAVMGIQPFFKFLSTFLHRLYYFASHSNNTKSAIFLKIYN